MRWLRKAAEQGYVPAQHGLGFLYAKGRGVPRDDAEAVVWYREAAEQGYVVSQFRLGAMYAKGGGVPQDYVQAHNWYNLAASQGDATARNNRDRLAEKMTPADISKAQRMAREWLEAFEKRKRKGPDRLEKLLNNLEKRGEVLQREQENKRK